MATAALRPAGFWQRATAWSIDAALLVPPTLLLAWPALTQRLPALQARAQSLWQAMAEAMADALIDGTPALQLAWQLRQDPALLQATAALQAALWSALWPPLLAFALLGAVWHVGFECSRARATPGQRLLGLRVGDRDGHRLGIGHALGRHLAGALSWLTLNLGHLMAAAAPQHLALHDRVSGSRVQGDGRALPGWAWLWLLAVGVATAWAGWRLARLASQALLQALEAALY